MKRHRLRSAARALAALLVLASVGASSAWAAPAPTLDARARAPIQSETLANGLKVVVVEDHAAPVVQTAMWYRFGANQETQGKTGLAHGLEHMMFRGTPSISSGGLDELSARLGAELNANTANDYTHFYSVVPADRLALTLRIEADRMRNLTLSEKDWKLEKGAVLSEYDGDLSQPVTKLYDAVCRAATSARLCSLSALGERADIVRSNADDLRRYYDANYAPNNATLVITGDVRPAAAFALAQQAFGSLAARPLPTPTRAQTVYTQGKKVEVSADFPFQVVDLAYAVPGNQDPSFAALQLVDAVIGNQRSAFYQNLVLSGLTLGYQTSYDDNVHDGLYHVFLVIAPGHTATQARAAFERTLKATEQNGFPLDLIDAGKKAVAANAVYARDSITGLGDRVGFAVGVEGVSDPQVDDDKIQNATPDDVTGAAKRFLNTPAVIGTLTPRTRKPGDLAGPAGGGVSDTFGNRAPSGPIVLAPWARAALERPVTLRSKMNPVRFTLPNGMTVLVQEVHTNPTVFISGHIDSSPRFDPLGKEGTGALATALLAYGGEKYDFNAQRRISDELAATLNLGQTFGAHGMARDTGTLLSLLADGERNPTFPAQYVELMRAQTLAGIKQRAQDPDYLATRAFTHLLLAPTDPALRESDVASVKAIAKSDLQHYVHAYLRPDLTTISIVGDVTPSAVRTQLESAFGTWSANGPKPDVAEEPIPVPKAASAHIPAVREAVSVRIGQPALSRRNPDFYALNLMNQILGGGGGFDTRLMNEIRVKRGLAYSVSSTLEVDRYRGTLTIDFSAGPRDVAPALAVLKEQMLRLQREPVAGAELARAKSKLIAGALVSEQSTDAILARVENIGVSELPTDYYQTLSARYNGIDAAAVQHAARTYLLPDHLIEVLEGP